METFKDSHGPNQSQQPPENEKIEQQKSSERPYRLRACVACRNTKTKCIPLDNRDSCKACYKHSRECVRPGPPKPPMRARHKISELERKLQLLTDAVFVKDSLQRNDLPVDGNSNEILQQTMRQDRFHIPPVQPSVMVSDSLQIGTSSTNEKAWWMSDNSTVLMLYNHWAVTVRPFFPFINLPNNGDITLFRSENPLLFLTILTVGSFSILPGASVELVKHLDMELARYTYVDEIHSIELIHSLLLFSYYFVSKTNPTKFAFVPHIYIASSISYDLGLDRQAVSKSALGDERSADAARTWLAAFYTMSISATLLRRQSLGFDSGAIRSAMTNLLDNPRVRMADRSLCCLVKLQIIVEDASLTIVPLSFAKEVHFEDSTIQFQLKALRQRLEEWRSSVSEESLESFFLKHMYHSARLYIHHVAIRSYIGRMFSDNDTSNHARTRSSLSALHTEALGICLDSAYIIFNNFSAVDLTVVRCLPSFYLMWLMSAAVCLVKLAPYVKHHQASETSSTSEEQSIHGLDLTTHLINSATNKLELACQNGYMPHGKPFATAFKRLRALYLQKATLCLNSRLCNEEPQNGQVHDILATNPNSQVQGTGTHQPSNDVLSDADIAPYLQQNSDASVQNPGQKQHAMLDQSLWPTGDAPPIDSSYGSHVPWNTPMSMSDPSVDFGTDGNVTDMADFLATQSDEFMFAADDEWLRSLLG